MRICPICFTTKTNFKQLSCTHSCCYECFVNWIYTQNYSKLSSLPCFAYNCKKKSNLVQIFPSLPEPYKTRLKPIYSFFCMSSEDNQDNQGKSQTNCSCNNIKNLSCNNINCKFPKRKPKGFKEKLKHLIELKNEFLSQNWKKLFTKKCPNCKVPTSREGGCSHVFCLNCQFEYCWICQHKYPYHYSLPHRIDDFYFFVVLILIAGIIGNICFLIYQIPFVKTSIDNFLSCFQLVRSIRIDVLIEVYQETWKYFVGIIVLLQISSTLSGNLISTVLLLGIMWMIYSSGLFFEISKIMLLEFITWETLKKMMIIWRAYKDGKLKSTLMSFISYWR